MDGPDSVLIVEGACPIATDNNLISRWASLLMASLALAGCEMSPQRAAEEGARAQQLIADGQLVEAAKLLQSVAAKRDDRVDIWLLLGRTHMSLGHYPDAYVAYSNVIDLDRANREALATLAQLSLRSGDYASAIKFASQIQSLDPSDTLAQLVLAFAAIGQQRFTDANAIADTLLSQNPNNSSARVIKSIILDRKGDLIGALGALASVRAGNSLDVMQQLRALYDKTADTRAKIPILIQLVKMRPADASVRIALAKQFYLLKQFERGATILNRVLATARGDGARLDITEMWLDTGLDAKLIEQSIEGTVSPNEVFKLAGAEFALARQEPAVALSLLSSMTSAKPVTPATADYFGAAAFAQAMLGQRERASSLAEAVLAVDKTQPKALAARGRVSLLRGTVNPAIRDARLLIRDNPTSPDGYLLLAHSYARQGNLTLSDRAFEDGKAAMPNNVEFAGYYSERLVARHDIDGAAALLRSFTIRNPSSMAGWTMRKRICLVGGNAVCATRADAIIKRLAGTPIPFPPLPADEVQSDAALIDLT